MWDEALRYGHPYGMYPSSINQCSRQALWSIRWPLSWLGFHIDLDPVTPPKITWSALVIYTQGYLVYDVRMGEVLRKNMVPI